VGNPQGITRAGDYRSENQEIGRSELFGQSDLPAVDSKNFVLYPGKAHDRSACGAGTSAQRACLDADGKIREGQIWKQESIVGSVFEGSITASGGQVYPSLKGTAFVNSEAELLPDPQDPFCMGIRG
jgi:4-hydroxyproline epimerase